MRTFENAMKVLKAINAKMDDVGEHPTLETAKQEAEDIINAEGALSPEQARLLREYVDEVLELTLNPKRFPQVGGSGVA